MLLVLLVVVVLLPPRCSPIDGKAPLDRAAVAAAAADLADNPNVDLVSSCCRGVGHTGGWGTQEGRRVWRWRGGGGGAGSSGGFEHQEEG